MHRIAQASGLPVITRTNAAWFTSGTVAVQRCTGCSTLQHPPEEVCHACGGTAFDTDDLAPHGTVVSYTVVHHAASRATVDLVPYTVVLVSLDDAPRVRVVGNLEGDVHIGLRVAAHWDTHHTDEGEAIRLIQWHPR